MTMKDMMILMQFVVLLLLLKNRIFFLLDDYDESKKAVVVAPVRLDNAIITVFSKQYFFVVTILVDDIAVG